MSRARIPDREGYVTREGVRLFYEVYGSGRDTILLLPTWSIIHSRLWKAQIAYLARHFRVITFDGRGNGNRIAQQASPPTRGPVRSGCGRRPGRHQTGDAFLAGLSCGALWATLLAADHPERVRGVAYIGPEVARAQPSGAGDLRQLRGGPERRFRAVGDVQPPLLAQGLPGLLGVLLRPDVPRAALDQADRGLHRWALETDPETLADTMSALTLCRLESFKDTVDRIGAPSW